MTPSVISLVEKQAPSDALRSIVEEYIFRKISLPVNTIVHKEMPCRHVNSLDFFLGGSYKTFHCSDKESMPFARCTIRGPRTHRKYRIEISEDFICFSIRFKPTGIYQLLGIPMSEFCDQAIDASLLKPAAFTAITEQLMACEDLHDCVMLIEPFLLSLLSHSHRSAASIDQLATLIRNATPAGRMSELYKDIPVSGRHLERNFIKEIGVTPKTYSNLLRFEKVMQAKKDRPSETWSSIAYEFNYFDQMHLVKDFKKYLNISPGAFHPGDFAL
jgi:AraC-like DNA-binding protein